MNQFQDLFDRQKRCFATGVTRSHGWRIEQLDRMSRLVAENEAELQKAIAQDFKTASQEQIFETRACLGEVAFQKSQLDEWMKPVEAPVPRALAATGHRGVVYRDHVLQSRFDTFRGRLRNFRNAGEEVGMAMKTAMKLTTGILAITITMTAVGTLAAAQNTDAIDNARSIAKSLQQKQANDTGAALDAAGTPAPAPAKLRKPLRLCSFDIMPSYEFAPLYWGWESRGRQ